MFSISLNPGASVTAMDPLSITVACFTLVATISKVSYSLLEFTQSFRVAKGDLEAIQSELQSFQTILDSLCQQFVEYDEVLFPPSLIQQILDTLYNSDVVVSEIETCLVKHSQSILGKSGYWTLVGGKNDMAERRTRLEAHKSLLQLLINMAIFHVTMDIKKDTAQSGRRSLKPSPKTYLENTSYRGQSIFYPLADEMLPDYEEIWEDYETITGCEYSVGQRRFDYSRPLLSVPFPRDTWNRALISWTSNYSYNFSSSLGLYNWPGSLSCNVNSGPIVFIKLTPWLDSPPLTPSLACETIYRCLPNDCPVLRLGRSCAKRLPEPNCAYFNIKSVSRHHCEIYHKNNGKWCLRDLGSVSGTFLNSIRLSGSHHTSKPAFLRERDVIELGLFVRMTISFYVGWGS